MVTSLLSAKALRVQYLTKSAYTKSITKQRKAIVVGATSGIGQGCARRLAQQGYQILAVGRGGNKPGRAEDVIQDLKEASASTVGDDETDTDIIIPNHEFYSCDCFSLQDIKSTASKIMANHDSIDALIMTQGMATTQGFTPTLEGNDEKLTLHYYSRIAFTQCLLPALQKSNMPAVVLSVLSGGVHSPYKNYNNDPSLKDTYSIKNAADAAGYYNDLGFDKLALDNPQIAFVHASPGFINTNWGSEFPTILRGMVRLLQPLGRNPSDCAEYMLSSTILARDATTGGNVAIERLPSDRKDGLYIIGQYGESQTLTNQHTKEARDFIWNHTQEVLKKSGI